MPSWANYHHSAEANNVDGLLASLSSHRQLTNEESLVRFIDVIVLSIEVLLDNLAKTIARDETIMSTLDCTRKLSPTRSCTPKLIFDKDLFFENNTSLYLYWKREE